MTKTPFGVELQRDGTTGTPLLFPSPCPGYFKARGKLPNTHFYLKLLRGADIQKSNSRRFRLQSDSLLQSGKWKTSEESGNPNGSLLAPHAGQRGKMTPGANPALQCQVGMRALPLGHIFPPSRVRKLLFGNNYVLLIASLIVLINSLFCLPVVLKYWHCK